MTCCSSSGPSTIRTTNQGSKGPVPGGGVALPTLRSRAGPTIGSPAPPGLLVTPCERPGRPGLSNARRNDRAYDDACCCDHRRKSNTLQILGRVLPRGVACGQSVLLE